MNSKVRHPEVKFNQIRLYKSDANPPEPALLTELIDALETRFLGDQQVRVETLQGQYNSFAIESSTEEAPAVMDRFKLIMQS
jgi:hypothetical protein